MGDVGFLFCVRVCVISRSFTFSYPVLMVEIISSGIRELRNRVERLSSRVSSMCLVYPWSLRWRARERGDVRSSLK